MSGLLEAIFSVISNAPAEKVEQLARIVSELTDQKGSSRMMAWATTSQSRVRLKRLTTNWGKEASITGSELAAMIRASSFIHDKVRNEQVTELVWTGPSSELVATRKTEQVLLQVIDGARNRLFLTSFVAYKFSKIGSALNDALSRGISVSILLERSENEGGGVSIDGIAAMKKVLPDASVYAWDNKLEEFQGGKVHAKVVVADESICFISSANLTEHAMERNIEAGVLIQGGPLPQKLHRHLEALVTTKHLSLV